MNSLNRDKWEEKLTIELFNFADYRNAGDYLACSHTQDDIFKLIRTLLEEREQETIKRCLEKAKDIVKVGIQHGILPIPNPHGDMVRIKRHNQVVVECKDITISMLDQAISAITNIK